MRLTPNDHDPRLSGLAYVYPVVSRRAGGVSVGINLSPNRACNWRCVYCQVEGLVLGAPSPVELAVLERELGDVLDAIVHGDFLERHAPAGARRLRDVAFSGNGEPTLAPQFEEAVAIAARAVEALGPAARVPLVLITNGSRLERPEVRGGLERLARAGGEVWFKLDSATAAGRARLNSAPGSPERALEQLRAAASLCPTWIQTIRLAFDGAGPSEQEDRAYLAALERVVAEGLGIRGVLLYGLARPSFQPEAPRLAPLPAERLEAFAERVRALGLEVRVSP